jgi:DNA-binding beta-propeller fold protein YncE
MMKNNKSVIIILSIVIITSIILATNFSSFSFGQEKTNTKIIGFNHIRKFDSNGKFITSWGSKGSGNGQFNENHGIDIDSSGNVYVVDTRNNRIQKFSSDGTFILKWGSEGCGADEFLIPHDITIDSSDNIYISDSGNVHFKSKVKCP